MFFKSRPPALIKPAPAFEKQVPSLLGQDMHIIGNIVSGGVVEFDGNMQGNIKCQQLTIRRKGEIKGDVYAEIVHVYGKVSGLIRARVVQLYASCHVEGIIMHETLSIEDGAFVDGKFKRTDKLLPEEGDEDYPQDDQELKVLENLRLIS